MSRRTITKDWYKIKRILSYECAYSIIFGERKNGKTYAAKEEIIKSVKNGRQFMYVRRRHRMITKRKMKKLFDDIEEMCVDYLGSLIYYNGQGEFYILHEGERITVGFCTCIEDAYVDKGIPYNKVEFVLFDEFIDYEYMKDEIPMFRHTIANIVRDEEKQGVKIIMLGNTVSKYCPYFEYFGFNINKIKQGEIAVIRATNGGTAALEYTKSRVLEADGKKKSKYFGFDGANSDMILHGAWEYNSCNTREVDGIGWSTRRKRIEAYVTGLENVYEMSYTSGKNPVAFIRSPNTQNGRVAKEIKYNLSFDNSLTLVQHDGKIVPKYRKLSPYIDEKIRLELKIIYECYLCGRIVYQSEQICTEFQKAFEGIYK